MKGVRDERGGGAAPRGTGAPRNVLVTGAGGFIGRTLATRLGKRLTAGEIDTLTLVDVTLPRPTSEMALAGLHRIEGDLAREQVLAEAVRVQPDLVFHLAGVTSRQAEAHPERSLRTNLLGTVALFERLAGQHPTPVVVFASSIGVHGTPLPDLIDDRTPVQPTLTYGTHKRMVELLLADYTRRGRLDGRSPRLPGIIARPLQPSAALSAFADDMIRSAAIGKPFTCPVGPPAQVLLLSLSLCVDHLLRVASIHSSALPAERAFHLPALQVRIGELAEALQQRFGTGCRIDFEPQPELEAQFGHWPPLHADVARSLGLADDHDLDALITRALAC